MADNNERYAEELIPSNYASWRYCIEVKCGLALTSEFLRRRIAILEDPSQEESRRFIELYGKPYYQQVLAWFQRAASEV